MLSVLILRKSCEWLWSIVIGQACEFDYSGISMPRPSPRSFEVVLVAPSHATIMTDPAI